MVPGPKNARRDSFRPGGRGALGNDLRVEFKAVGDTVNLASRIEGIAEPGATFVTEDTFNLTEGLFTFEALGPKTLKGFEKSVTVYRVIGPTTRRTRFDVSTNRGLTPLVGRDRELDLLNDSLERARIGHGQAVSIVAEAGVGKSRLLYEFRKGIANEDLTFLEGRCLSYSKGVPYHLHSDALKANFNIDDDCGHDDIKARVQKGLRVLQADEAAIRPFLLGILGIRDSPDDLKHLSPEAWKERTIEAVKEIVLRGAEQRPLVLVFEDLHWVDNNSEEILKYLLESIPGARILLMFTYRPEFVHTWGGRSYHNQITLNRLTNRESLAMATAILATPQIDSELENLILEKTEGVPFFIEEFLRSLQELNMLTRRGDICALVGDAHDHAIPATIQDVIMARVDALPDAVKHVLQAASAIEREFSYALIQKVTALPREDLLSHLSVLKNAELLYERGIFPQATYVFKHALTREVVYDAILAPKKIKLHQTIGQVLEASHRENLREYYGVLSEHFTRGADLEKGAAYSLSAGKLAQKKSSYKDAIAYAHKGVGCLEKLPPSDAVKKRIIDARTALAVYCMILNYHDEAMRAVAPIVDLAESMDYRQSLPAIYVAMGSYKTFCEVDFATGMTELADAVAIAEKAGDFLALWMAYYFLGSVSTWDAAFEKGIGYFQKALAWSTAADNLTGICFVQGTLAAMNYTFSGTIGQAYELAGKTRAMAKNSGDIFVQQMAFAATGACSLFKGELRQAEDDLRYAVDLHQKTPNVIWGPFAYFWLGELYLATAEYAKANFYMDQTTSIMEDGKVAPSWVNLSNLNMIRVASRANKEISLESVMALADRNRLKLMEGFTAYAIADILMHGRGLKPSAAGEWIEKAIDADNRNGIPWNLGRDYHLLAQLLHREGDLTGARAKLASAIDIMRGCGASGWARKYEEGWSRPGQ